MIVCKGNHTDNKSVLQYIRYKYTLLLAQYCSGDKIRRMGWGEYVAHMVERRGEGKPEGNRPLGIPRRRWKDNIKMDLQEVECRGTDWIELAQDRDRWWALANAVMNLRVP